MALLLTNIAIILLNISIIILGIRIIKMKKSQEKDFFQLVKLIREGNTAERNALRETEERIYCHIRRNISRLNGSGRTEGDK